jgi:hypothetical protein
MPLVRLLKISAWIIHQDHVYRGTFIRSLPVQLLAHSAAALGQASGLLFGQGDAQVDFLHYELNQNRRMSNEH